MLVNISAQFPKEIEAAANADQRATFRRSLENRLRGRMNALRDEAAQTTIYQALADKFRVEQSSGQEEIGFALVNDSPGAPYLEALGGTRPHLIVQRPHVVPLDALLAWSGGDMRVAKIAQARIAVRGVTIHHPGTKPDAPVISAVNEAEQSLIDAATDAIDKWADKLGAEVVA